MKEDDETIQTGVSLYIHTARTELSCLPCIAAVALKRAVGGARAVSDRTKLFPSTEESFPGVPNSYIKSDNRNCSARRRHRNGPIGILVRAPEHKQL